MQRSLWSRLLLGVLCIIGLAATAAWAQPAKAKLERLRIAVAPLGWDTKGRFCYDVAAGLRALQIDAG